VKLSAFIFKHLFILIEREKAEIWLPDKLKIPQSLMHILRFSSAPGQHAGSGQRSFMISGDTRNQKTQ